MTLKWATKFDKVHRVKSKMDGHGLKWTALTTKIEQSWVKLDGLRKWTVRKSKSGWPNERKLNGLLITNCTIKKDQTKRSLCMKTVHFGSKDRLVSLKWTLILVQGRSFLDGLSTFARSSTLTLLDPSLWTWLSSSGWTLKTCSFELTSCIWTHFVTD